MNGKKITANRVLALVLASLMVLAALVSVVPLFAYAAEEDELSYPISGYNPGVPCPDPVPLLCIVVNFDANGNGIDDNPDGKNYSKVTDKKGDLYGEQWCHFDHDIWADILFAEEGQTLMNYYKMMSNGKFYFTPAPETYADESKNGVVNDGIVEVVIHGKHLNTQSDYVYYYKQALQQVDEYVDFSVFDKNGNGKIDQKELVISFINGGAELAQTPYNWQNLGDHGMEAFRSRAYYRKDDGTMLYDSNEGYKVGYGGLFTTGSWSYLSERADKATEFAVWAHELGHYLGAPDYYDTDKGNAGGIGNDFVTGYYSLMGKGCHGGKPSHLDPFTMTSECTGYGFYAAQNIMEDGEYTLYSKTSSKGTYNVIKLNTPNPDEYYLIENRYVSPDYDGESFDEYGISDKQGIVIWHVDEGSFSRAGANNATSDKDPTLAVYATNSKVIARSYGEFPVAFGGSVKVFNPTEYKFPYSGTWYTTQGRDADAVAEAMKNLRVEIISEPGEEMKIKVTGSYRQELLPEFNMLPIAKEDRTQSSLTFRGTLKTLNNATVTEASFTVTEIETVNGETVRTVKKEGDFKLNSEYEYAVSCDGLKPGTKYEFKIKAKTSHGDLELVSTESTSPPEKKYANITMVINSDQYTQPMSQKVEVGKEHVIRVQISKSGYYFDGWYLDEEYTKPYTPGIVEKEGDFTIYAKWVKGSAPSETTAGTTASSETIPSMPSMPDEPVSGGCGGSAAKGAEPMLFGGAVLAILGAAAGAKKKKEDK